MLELQRSLKMIEILELGMGRWFSIAMFFLSMWCITIVLLIFRIEQVIKLKREWVKEIKELEKEE